MLLLSACEIKPVLSNIPGMWPLIAPKWPKDLYEVTFPEGIRIVVSLKIYFFSEYN